MIFLFRLTVFISILYASCGWHITTVSAQTLKKYELGTPLIRNYSKKEYKAFSQNWGVVQDKRGLLYFANGDGVLEYDGVNWRTIKLKGDQTAFAIAIDKNNIIYVGAISEFGYLEPNKYGELHYISLLYKFNEKNPRFTIRGIIPTNEGLYFNSNEIAYRYLNGKITSWKIGKPCNIYYVYGKLIVWNKEVGIKVLENDKIIAIDNGAFFNNLTLMNLLPYYDGRVLAATREKGLFLISGLNKKDSKLKIDVEPFITKIDNFIQRNSLVSAFILNNGNYAIATSKGGTAIIDSKGNLVQILDKNSNVQSDSHTNMVLDNRQALWLTLNNGITKAEINSQISYWNDASGVKGNVLSILRYHGTLYVGTWQGLFYLDLSEKKTLPKDSLNVKSEAPSVRQMNQIKSRIWNLETIKNPKNAEVTRILAASAEGVHDLKNNCKLLSEGRSYRIYQSQKHPDLIFVGLEDGVALITASFSQKDIVFKNEGRIKGISDKVLFINEDNTGKIWFSTDYNRIFLLDPSASSISNITVGIEKKYFYHKIEIDTSYGIPLTDNLIITKHRGNTVFINSSGIFLLQNDKKSNKIKFVRETQIADLIISKLFYINAFCEDKNGTVWMQVVSRNKQKKITLIAKPSTNGGYNYTFTPFKPIPMMDIFTIYPEVDGVTWFGGDDGLFRYDNNVAFNNKTAFNVLIRKVVLEKDSVIFGGTYFTKQSNPSIPFETFESQPDSMKPIIGYDYNSVQFYFSANEYFDESSNVYKYFLEGFDKKWSAWSNESKKGYTNLPPGKYVFHVKAKDLFDNESKEVTYEFSIKPPWYRTNLAYIFYLAALLVLVYIIVKFSNKRLIDAKMRLEHLVELRTREIGQQKMEIEKEKEKSEKLLLNVLPFKIAEELKKSGHAKTQYYERVSVMFADIKGFTQIAESTEPQELIKELDYCFAHLDDFISRRDVEKIKTIGDALLCVGGIPIKNYSNPVDVVLAALEIQHWMAIYRNEKLAADQLPWHLRIGIHTGEIIAGVVGKKKFSYDIWGDTVNTASRMESASEIDKINISGITYNYVKDFFKCEYRGKIAAKHKGEIDMYYVERIKEELSNDIDGIAPNRLFLEMYSELKSLDLLEL